MPVPYPVPESRMANEGWNVRAMMVAQSGESCDTDARERC